MLATLEVRSAFERRLRLGEISPEAFDIALHNLADITQRISRVPIEENVLTLAAEIIGRNMLRSLDAIQLASVMLAVQELELEDELVFIASDHRLLAAAAAEGIATWDPAAPPPINVPVN